jgi:TolA-binding protein
MNDLDAEDRALLDLARAEHEPSDADRRRVRRALVVSLGAAGGLATTTAVGTAAAASVAGSGAIATKMVALAVVAAALGGGTVAVYHRTQHGTDPKPAARPVATRAEPPVAPQARVPAPLILTAPAVPPPTEPVPAAAAPAVSAPRNAQRPIERPPLPTPPPIAPAITPPPLLQPDRPVATAASAAPAVALSPTTIEDETRIVRAGITALHAGDAARALALFDDHARRYPGGVLAEERSAERVIALYELGRDVQARAAFVAFVRAHPGSPLVARIRAVCDLPNP